MEKVIKKYFRILKKTHAYLQAILKAQVKFQKDQPKTVGGVKGIKAGDKQKHPLRRKLTIFMLELFPLKVYPFFLRLGQAYIQLGHDIPR